MGGKKIYLQPVVTLISAVNDLIEIQKGRITFSDTPNGKIHFLVKMYAFKWELRFSVKDIGLNRCQVELKISGEQSGHEKLINREFALLDSMLISLAEIELTANEAASSMSN